MIYFSTTTNGLDWHKYFTRTSGTIYHKYTWHFLMLGLVWIGLIYHPFLCYLLCDIHTIQFVIVIMWPTKWGLCTVYWWGQLHYPFVQKPIKLRERNSLDYLMDCQQYGHTDDVHRFESLRDIYIYIDRIKSKPII